MEKKQNRLRDALYRGYQYANEIQLLKAIREGLLMVVPVIMIGAIALVLRSFPLKPYLNFIQTFAGGAIDTFLAFIYQATFGVLSVYMLMSLTVSYLSKVKHKERNYLGPVFASFLAFCISSGLFKEGADFSSALGVSGMFTAVLCALISSKLYCWVQKKVQIDIHFYTEGVDDTYYNMICYIMPILFVAIVAALFNLLLHMIFGVDSVQEAYTDLITALFGRMDRNFGSAVLYVFMVHFLWFFGVHGGNVLDVVGRNVFEPALDINASAMAAGNVPTEIFSKSFFDVFILMGGCGSTLCLIGAILIFERRRSMRRLAKVAAVPGLFNMNELIVFGVPIVYNPVLFIPFFLTPLVCLVTSTIAMKTGLVPVVYRTVEWTTPIILGGYYATGSVAGAVLQGVNFCLGILIYKPFIAIMGRQSEKDSEKKVKKLVRILQESEESRIPVKLLELGGDAGTVAKLLGDDLEQRIEKAQPNMYYQPQYNDKNRCIGAEALLRWEHPVYGMIYPPLVIQLMEEIGLLTKGEEIVVETVLKDMERIKKTYGENIEISINVTGVTIQLDEFENFLQKMVINYPAHIRNVMIEITEQASLTIDDSLIQRLARIKNMGYRLAIDDFSMGNTSVKYLQSNVFDLIKLDGALTRDMEENERSRSIVKTMANMAKEFKIDILAEYVETEEQKKLLGELGCHLYQGYLYSPAIPLKEFLDRGQEH
jgi:lactose/cellobiose-specific phosphotransferase system IIC component